MQPTKPGPERNLDEVRATQIVSGFMDANPDAERDTEDLVEYTNFVRLNRNRVHQSGRGFFKLLADRFKGMVKKVEASCDDMFGNQ